MPRTLAKVGTISKGTAQGLAGFFDFKRAFEDAMRKNKWEKEAKSKERIEGRYKQAGEWGYQPKPEDMGTFLAGGNVPMTMPGGLTSMGEEEKKYGSELRKEFDAAKVRKDYQTISRSVKGLEEAYRLSINPDTKSKIASDQALGVLFQKMLDPASVVRESEYARTPEGAGIVNRAMSILPQLQKGGLRLADEDRQALVEMGRKLLVGAQEQMNIHINRYEELAKLYGVRRKAVFGGLKKFDIKPSETGVNTQLDTQINQMLDNLGVD